MMSDQDLAITIRGLARANYERALTANVLALAEREAPPPPEPPRVHVVAAPQPCETAILNPYYDRPRPAPIEPSADLPLARDRLREALGARAETAAALADATAALERADALIAEIEADLAAQRERAEARTADLAERTRQWIAHPLGPRPEAGLEAPSRTQAELTGASVARLGLAADHAAAQAAGRRAAEAVDDARRAVLGAVGQSLAAELDAAEAALAELRGEAAALVSVHIAGAAPWHGSLPARTAGAPRDRDAEARWAAFAGRLLDDADAQP
jgi:hypothetical protein